MKLVTDLKKVRRKRRARRDPNDRGYDPMLNKKIRRMSPMDFQRHLDGDLDINYG